MSSNIEGDSHSHSESVQPALNNARGMMSHQSLSKFCTQAV